jgi:hypothetical protein
VPQIKIIGYRGDACGNGNRRSFRKRVVIG